MQINLKFYTVKMPSGRKYYVSGKSKKQIAGRNCLDKDIVENSKK